MTHKTITNHHPTGALGDDPDASSTLLVAKLKIVKKLLMRLVSR
jgi:hypothetical protein